MKSHDFDKIVKKFGLHTRHGRDLHAWFEHEGRVIVRTRRSKGSADLPERLISKQLALTVDQLRTAVRCKLKLEGFVQILRERGMI